MFSVATLLCFVCYFVCCFVLVTNVFFVSFPNFSVSLCVNGFLHFFVFECLFTAVLYVVTPPPPPFGCCAWEACCLPGRSALDFSCYSPVSLRPLQCCAVPGCLLGARPQHFWVAVVSCSWSLALPSAPRSAVPLSLGCPGFVRSGPWSPLSLWSSLGRT